MLRRVAKENECCNSQTFINHCFSQCKWCSTSSPNLLWEECDSNWPLLNVNFCWITLQDFLRDAPLFKGCLWAVFGHVKYDSWMCEMFHLACQIMKLNFIQILQKGFSYNSNSCSLHTSRNHKTQHWPCQKLKHKDLPDNSLAWSIYWLSLVLTHDCFIRKAINHIYLLIRRWLFGALNPTSHAVKQASLTKEWMNIPDVFWNQFCLSLIEFFWSFWLS